MAAFNIGYGPSYQVILSSVHLNPLALKDVGWNVVTRLGRRVSYVVRSRVILRI